MKNRSLKTLRAAALATGLGLAAIVPGTSSAQMAPPMDMSWAIRSQMQLQAYGDYTARATAMAYYNYMQQLRRSGYTGPSLPTGVTPESLRASINGLNQSYQSYNAAAADNSRRTSNAINDYSMRAIRGCSYGYDQYGHYGYICP